MSLNFGFTQGPSKYWELARINNIESMHTEMDRQSVSQHRIVLEEKIRNGNPKQRPRRWECRAPPERARSLVGLLVWPAPRPQPRGDLSNRARVRDGQPLPACHRLYGDNS